MTTHTRARRSPSPWAVAALALSAALAAAAASCSTPSADVAATPSSPPAPAAPPATDMYARAAANPLAAPAKAYFWDTFSLGRYDERAEVLHKLTAAFAEDNTDGELALLIAQTHLWIVAERARLDDSAEQIDIVDQLGLAEQFFEQAAALRPDDRRIPGWIAGVQMQQARLAGDRAAFERAEADGRAAWSAYPEFNGFTFGYTLSAEPSRSAEFETARRAMWDAVRECSGGRVSMYHPDAGDVRETVGEHDPVCSNTPRAPHNFEGFWWILGQMESKSERIDRARACLDNARLSQGFEDWPVGEAFEQDATDLHTLNAELRANPRRMVFNTANSCMACHQAR